MPWIELTVAGLFEIAWALGLKYTYGWTRLLPSVLTVIGMAASFYFLSRALKVIPIGTAYAIWTGIGAVGTAILGIIIFKEPLNAARVVCVAMIVAGIVGLKLTSTAPE
ncbi:MAG TPA: quaternary ammonium compound efflux SMR transporter SugE [Planctomycetota bacterium]|nr:quaternary ammonium compound efflux SMR transporter SugE [Planctomycetota bacterium]